MDTQEEVEELTLMEQMAPLAQRAAGTLGTGYDFDNRILYVVGDVDEAMFMRVLVGLNALEEEEGPITVMLHSGGGEELPGYGIYDAFRMFPYPVVIQGFGIVGSMASIILQAADYRVLTKECQFLVHNGSMTFGGVTDGMFVLPSEKAISVGADVKRSVNRYTTILARHTHLTLSEVQEICGKDEFLSARQALKLGFIDKIAPTRKKFEIAKKRKKTKKKEK